MLKTITARLLPLLLLLATLPMAGAQIAYTFDQFDYGTNPDHVNAGGPVLRTDAIQSQVFEIGGGVTMTMDWDWPNTPSGHPPARYDIVVDERFIDPGPDGIAGNGSNTGAALDDLGLTLRLQNGASATGGSGFGDSNNGIYTFTFSEPVYLTDWDAGGLDYGGSGAEHIKVSAYADVAQTTLVAADTIENLTWDNTNSVVDASHGALIDDSIADGDGYHTMATRGGTQFESLFRFGFTTTPVRVIVMEVYATSDAPGNYRNADDVAADDGLVIDLVANPGASDPDNVFLNQVPAVGAGTPDLFDRGRSYHFGIVNFTKASSTCKVAFVCGANKAEDADAFDHGMIEYLAGEYDSVVTPIEVLEGGGNNTATDLSTGLPFTLDTASFDAFDYIVVSSSLETGDGFGDLWTAMKPTTASILSFARRTAANVGMGANYINVNGTDHYDPALGSDVQILDYPTTAPTHPYSVAGINGVGAAAEVLLEHPSDNTYKTFVRYDIGETLADSSIAPGVRVFYSLNIDGAHEEPGSSGTPVPISEWFDPTADLTPTGLAFLNNALASAACPPSAPAGVACTGSDIGGTVFRDYNLDGVQGANDPGYGAAGMLVRAYDANNSLVGAAPISVDGSYALAGLTPPVRLEFSGLPDWLKFGGVGGGSGSGVLFVGAATCDADLAVNNPAEFCDTTPMLAASCYINGDDEDDGNPATPEDALVIWDYGNTNTTGTITKVADKQHVGAVHGLAYSTLNSKLYSASFLKRHVGLGDGGLGAIYETDPFLGTPNGTVFAMIPNVGSVGSNALRGLAGANDPSEDADVFTLVGTVGLGDIDISQDGKTLYVVNLNDRRIYLVDIATATVSATSIAIPDPLCAGGVARVGAAKIHEGGLFVGVTCDASISQDRNDLVAKVYRMDLATNIFSPSEVVSIPLGYVRDPAWNEPYYTDANTAGGENFTDHSSRWYPWLNTYTDEGFNSSFSFGFHQICHPTPWLIDLEFDDDGNMLLGFTDRTAHQFFSQNEIPDGSGELVNVVAGGDLLRAVSSSGGFVVETLNYTGTVLEFFAGDDFNNHEEVVLGGLAVLHGTGEISSNVYDPIEFNTGGIRRLNATTGADISSFQLYAGTNPFAGKGAGLGDLELVCEQPAIIVGNRLWADHNGNGVQDPGEPGIAGATITLTCGGSSVTTTTAVDDLSTPWDETGSYYFSSADVGTPLGYNEACTISVDLDDPALSGYDAITSGAGATNDAHDNDADAMGVVAFVTGDPGENNYSFDIGVVAYDFGDLPEGGNKDFPTAGSNAGDRARHALGSGIALGTEVDSEDDGQPSVGANGDGADEDGFPLIPSLMPGASYSVPFTATVPSGSPVLNAWIDYDCSGTFDAGEQIATDLAVVDGTNVVDFTVPDDAVPGVAYARFRLSTDTGLGATGDASDGEVEDCLVTILSPVGAIGNYVWLDEDSDGQQNPGEPGIPNVTVQLYLDADGSGPDAPSLVATTVTDTDGGYLFPDLPAGCYYVDVLGGSVPASLSQTTLYTNAVDADSDTFTDEGDFGNKNHAGSGYKINLDANEVNLTADFGYNENPTADVNNPVAKPVAALGDKVWFDTDQDGAKDSDEVGIAGVTVALFSAGPDGLFGTTDDVSAGTQATDATGCYLFDGLTPDAYVVKVTDTDDVLTGLVQTGDPDHFGTTGSNNDGETTAPIVLGPGDVFLNADFGYYSDKSLLGAIGDKIWLDADASGGDETTRGSEPGLAGVTVALIADTDTDGVIDSGEPVIATATTDSAGCYLFEGLPVSPAGIGYIVWVNDTDNVLAGLAQTYDEDGPLDNTSSAVLTEAALLTLAEDFSYTSRTPIGSIGDTVWGDLDGSGGASRGGEAGLVGVSVDLCDSAGNTVASTVTDSNGNYLFANLPFGTYTVKVDDTTLPAGYGTTPSYDPEGGPDSESIVTIAPSNPNDRDQDFSYPVTAPAVGSIGDKVWVDSTGSGSAGDATQSATEHGLAGVTVTLTPPSGVDAGDGVDQPVTTVTDNDGCYLFTGLPFDSGNPYTVAITPPAGFANDFDSDGNSDGSSLVIVDGANPNPRDQDFSLDSAATLYSIGNTVWFDADSDGDRTEDPGDDGTAPTREAPISGVLVELCDAGGDTIATDVTDSAGQYAFNNLAPGNYTVKVITATLPAGVSDLSTFESDSGTDSETDVTIVAADQLGEDFAYPPLGAIGDTVFFDANDNDLPDLGEGLEGVSVRLCNAAGTVILAETATDSNGRYLFGDLPAGTYQVKVDPNGDTLPGTLVNTEDPDTDPDTIASPGDETSVVTLGVGEENLDQDFGYQNGTNGRIGNLVWLDLDADGVYEPGDGETPIGGVTVDLYVDANNNGTADPGEPLLGSVTTEAAINGDFGTNGNYCFANLPAGDYVVEVTDRDGVLAGYWHSLGATGIDDNSQQEAFALTLADGAERKNADFGYYLDPAKLGNFVWFDQDGDGQQDSGEPGLDGVEVTLEITYPDATVITLKTFTGDDPSTAGATEKGWYNFCNLLLDEDYRGAGGAGEPTYEISVATPELMEPTLVDVTAGGITDLDDSDDHTGAAAQPVQGAKAVSQNATPTAEQAIASYDFGFASIKEDTFAEFATANGLTGNDALPGPTGGAPNAGNPDGDIYSNALEYALCNDPNSGNNIKPFCIGLDDSPAGSGTVDAEFTRASPAPGDVTYTLMVAPAIGSPPAWIASSVVPTVTVNGDGTETVVYADLEAQNPNGIARLQVEIAGAAYYTPTFGWHTQTNGAECETYSYPYAEKSLFSGTSSTAGPSLTVDGTPAIGSGSYYIEILAGTYAGHRFDVASVGSDNVTLDPLSQRNTLAPLPDLTDAAFALRPHSTLGSIAPPELFAAQLEPDDGDRILAYVGGAWTTYWVFDMAGTQPKYWTSDADNGLGDVGNTVIDPCQGFFLHPRSGTVDVTSVGIVREWAFACPLSAGFNLVGSGYPVDQSPDDREMFKIDGDDIKDWFTASNDPLSADQLMFWLGDTNPAADGYDTYFRVDLGAAAYDHWTYQGDSNLADADSDELFELGRAAFYDMKAGHDRSDAAKVWLWPAPWDPDA